MALFISQKDDRTELQKQLAVELQRKVKETSKLTDAHDGVNDSQYIKGTKTTTSLAWVWALIAVAMATIIIWLTVVNVTR